LIRRAPVALGALVGGALACNALVGLRDPIPAPADAAADAAPEADAVTCVDAGLDTPSHVADFVHAVFEAACARMVRCAMIAPSDMDDCIAAVSYAQHTTQASAHPIFAASLASAELNGFVSLDRCAARECLDAFASAGCDLTSTRLLTGDMAPMNQLEPHSLAFLLLTTIGAAACERAFVGLSPLGGYCDDTRECVSGTTCAEECASPCQPPTSSLCKATCPPGPLGNACDPRLCTGSIVCGDAPCFCSDAGGAGDPCGGYPMGLRTTLICAEGLVCGPDKTCVAVGAAPNGAPCNGFDLACAPRLYCDPVTLRCAPRLLADAPCKSANACDDGMFCVGIGDAGVGTCRAPTLDGGRCDVLPGKSTTIGGDGCLGIVEHCDGARCLRYASDTVAPTCSLIPTASNAWCPPDTVPCPCTRIKGTGASCLYTQECQSFDCRNGRCQ
jgi:hypothetical protein